MKPSPLTFQELKFLKVLVEIDREAKAKPDEYSFNGTNLGWTVKHGRPKDEGPWWVLVGFSTRPHDQDDLSKRCPYIIDVQAVGKVEVSAVVDEAQREKLVFEYGAALVYGAIREMVSSITARSVLGLLMLPTPKFIGAYEDHLARLTEKAKLEEKHDS